jgi:hypothetical protein
MRSPLVRELIGERSPYSFNGTRYSQGERVISAQVIKRELERETNYLQDLFKEQAIALINGDASLSEFEEAIARGVRAWGIAMGALASGGINALSANHYQLIGMFLDNQFERLREFADQIEECQLSIPQIADRARRYGRSPREIFFILDKFTKQQRFGFNEGRRILDPLFLHCPQCVSYNTDWKWKPINEIVPTSVECSCSTNCRCAVEYRFNPVAALAQVLGR